MKILPLVFMFWVLVNYSKPVESRFSALFKTGTLCKVYKIDSVDDFYTIYGRAGGNIYKIVSQKQKDHDCRNIYADSSYIFRLHSYSIVNGKPIIPAQLMHDMCGWMVEWGTIIKFEGDSIRDIFSADNVKGLCFLK